MEWKDLLKKKIFLQVETSLGMRNYSGVIQDVIFMGKNPEGVEIYFIEILDKYNMKVGFNSDTIKFIQEER